MIIDNIGFYT